MEQTTTLSQADLFTGNLPSIDDIKKLSQHVHSSESTLMYFRQQLEAAISKESRESALAAGIGLYIVGRYAEAIEKLRKAKDCKEKHIYTALAMRQIGEFDKAIEILNKSLENQADGLSIALEKAATYRLAGKTDNAEKELKACSNLENVSAEYHYQLARIQERQGLYDKAVDNFKKALELSPNHQNAMFNLAYRYDLSGDEASAIEYYKKVVSTAPAYVSALLNLAVLYEDTGEYDKAMLCVDKVLKHHPNHQKALLFKRDIESSMTMCYDEDKMKKKERKNQILETPISDFELSVRSRNCLRKMNIQKIGDLLKVTETQLLAFKNFGETSLREIKEVLESKGLRLGIALEEKQLSPTQIADLKTIIGDKDEKILNKSVDEFNLSVRSKKCLQNLNIHTLGELICRTEAEFLGCKNFGVTSLNEIKRLLTQYGLSLRTLD